MEGLKLQKEKFQSAEEEISYLRNYIASREKQNESIDSSVESVENTRQVLEEYQKQTPEEVMDRGAVIPETIRQEIVLKLSPEDHDEKMGELISLVYEKGIANALDIVNRMEDAHIFDDFHRFLVQFFKEGHDIGVKESSPIAKRLGRTLFEVTLSYDKAKPEENLHNFLASMEQFYAGMISVADVDKDEYISVEIVNAIGSREFIFYVSVPDDKSQLLEKQLVSVFPNAILTEKRDDFNVFSTGGSAKGAYMMQEKNASEVIKDYEGFSNDPINVVLNVFSKLDEKTESAAVQLIFKPAGDFYLKNYKKALKKLEDGEKSPDELFVKNTFGNKFATRLSGLLKKANSKPKSEEPAKTDSHKIENVQKKIEHPIISTNFRVVVSAMNENRADSILRDVESAFNQFENTKGNKFKFIDQTKNLKSFFRKFSFREFDPSYDAPLNIREIATVIHMPMAAGENSPELKTNKMKTAPAPLTASGTGIFLGENNHRNNSTDIFFDEQDRLRHFYAIGQTGTGKTNILKHMIIQDIQNGDGVCMIDPHGSDIQDVLANIPKDRYEDVIYFDPSYIERPMALNMLEYDVTKPEQKTFVVNELFSIFQKLYGANPESMGPMFEQYFRNATMLVIEDPDSGSTLLDVSRVLADSEFREMKLSRCKNPVVVQFWREIASKAGGEASLQNIVPYITSKFDVFLANDVMRPIIAQQKSSFDFRKIMDEKKILLVNLSKGSLGDINSHLIGLILVGKILMAALSRSSAADKNYPPFYLYIDEFQNITTDSISTILSEARKYKLSLNVAHQFIAQLDQKIKDSVFGNVGSMAVFRVGSDDAEYLESQFSPVFSAKDIMNIDNFNAYVKMLSGGVPIDPFSLKVPKSPDGNSEQVDSLKKLSHLKHGRNREEVEKEVMDKYKK